ncbi:MAG: O-antigen ligase family protein [Gemmataceae bacterium]
MYGGWVCLSYMFADFYHEISALYLVVLLKMLLMFAVSAYLLRSVQQLWLLLIMAAFCLAYIGYEVNFQYLKVRKISILHSGYSGLDNNGAAMMLAMGVPLCLFVWEGTRRWWRWLFAAAIPSLIHAVLLTYSRGAMVTLVLTAPLFYLRSQHKKQMTLAFVAVGLMLPIMAGNEIRERFFSIQKYEEDDSAQSRFRSWQAGWEMALDHPLFGVGFRNSPVYMYRYGSEQDRTIHNLYIQIAADSGIVGMGIYVFALWSVWVGLVRARRVIRQHPGADTQHLKALVNGVECSMGVFCVGSLFLSLEVFELSYFLLLIGAQFPLLLEGHFQREPFIEAPAHELSYPEPTAVR